MPTAARANDTGPALAGAGGRDTRIVTVAGNPGQAPVSTGAMSRTQGIGTRFRAPNARLKEKTP